MTTPDPSHEAFEAWARSLPDKPNITREGDGYRYTYADFLWDAWQAAMAHKGAEVEQAHEARRQAQTELADMQEKRNRIGLDIDRALRGEVNEQSPIADRLKMIAGAGRWQPIETAPKDKTILLGHRNSHGHWRTLRGEWFSQEEIDELWEDPDGVEPGWFETSVEADDVPNVWHTNPTHWMPLPAAPNIWLPEVIDRANAEASLFDDWFDAAPKQEGST